LTLIKRLQTGVKAVRRFIHYENIKHFKELLERTTAEAERDRILKLLAEEEAKIPDNQPEIKSATETAAEVAAASCGESTPSQLTAKASESEFCELKREQTKESGWSFSGWL
jgi:hypothetical protein